jgi:hypothetical protein
VTIVADARATTDATRLGTSESDAVRWYESVITNHDSRERERAPGERGDGDAATRDGGHDHKSRLMRGE